MRYTCLPSEKVPKKAILLVWIDVRYQYKDMKERSFCCSDETQSTLKLGKVKSTKTEPFKIFPGHRLLFCSSRLQDNRALGSHFTLHKHYALSMGKKSLKWLADRNAKKPLNFCSQTGTFWPNENAKTEPP